MSQAPPAAAGRGLLLIAAAVVLGLILLSQGFDDGAASSRASNDGGVAVATSSTETVAPSTIPDALEPSQVPVVVSNAAGISGLAGQVSDQLAALGYITSEPETAAELSDFTAVYFAPNFEAEARAVADALGYPADDVVQPSPEPAPAGNGTEVVIVLLGADAETLAGGGAGATSTTAAPTDDTLLAPG
jgi:hypothetical protein